MAAVSVQVQVSDPQQWVDEAHLRSGNLFAGMPTDSIPAELQGISVAAHERCVVAEVEAASEAEGFWRLVDYARFLSLPSPALS
jgi:hypothetical protein